MTWFSTTMTWFSTHMTWFSANMTPTSSTFSMFNKTYYIIILWLYYYITYYIIICFVYLFYVFFFRDLSRKMRRNKLAPEARTQRRALDNLKTMSKISNMYSTYFLFAGRWSLQWQKSWPTCAFYWFVCKII